MKKLQIKDQVKIVNSIKPLKLSPKKILTLFKDEIKWHNKQISRYTDRKKDFRKHYILSSVGVLRTYNGEKYWDIYEVRINYYKNFGWEVKYIDEATRYFQNRIFTNTKFNMGKYMYVSQPNEKYRHIIPRGYYAYKTIYIERVYSSKPWQQHFSGYPDDLKVFMKHPIYETAYKQNWFHLTGELDIKKKKPISMLGLNDLISKEEFKHFLKWFKKNWDFQLWKDYVAMARPRRLNIFDPNFSRIHDDILEKTEKEANKAFENQKKIFELSIKSLDIQVIHSKEYGTLKELGDEMGICVGQSNYNQEDIWVAKANNSLICIEYRDNEFYQIRGYKNQSVPEKIENIIKKQILQLSQQNPQVNNKNTN